MAAGLPVICTPSESDRLVINHGVTGYFAYNDEEWYKYLKKLIEDPELREKMGKSGMGFATQNYGVEKIAQKYYELFDELTRANHIG